MDKDELRNRFTYHEPPDDNTRELHEAVRHRCYALASWFANVLPPSGEARRAVDALDDAMKHANAAIARHGLPS